MSDTREDIKDIKEGDEKTSVAFPDEPSEAYAMYTEEGVEIDQSHLTATPLTKFWRGVLFQMILFGALSFVGPAMSDATTNLGGGGLSTPYLANLATSLSYAASCVMVGRTP